MFDPHFSSHSNCATFQFFILLLFILNAFPSQILPLSFYPLGKVSLSIGFLLFYIHFERNDLVVYIHQCVKFYINNDTHKLPSFLFLDQTHYHSYLLRISACESTLQVTEIGINATINVNPSTLHWSKWIWFESFNQNLVFEPWGLEAEPFDQIHRFCLTFFSLFCLY